MMTGKNLDAFFREGLSTGNIPFEETHWLRLEKRLKKKKRTRIIAWIVSSGIAAMLLLALSVSDIFFKEKKEQPITVITKKPSPGIAPDTPHTEKEINTNRDVSLKLKEEGEVINSSSDAYIHSDPVRSKSRAAEPAGSLKNISAKTPSTPPVSPDAENRQWTKNIPVETNSPAEKSENPASEISPAETLALTRSYPQAAKTDTSLPAHTNTAHRESPFSLSLLAGPDINGVNTLKSGRGGLSAGILMNYKISENISISTGVVYAKKLYSARFADYKPKTNYKFPVSPEIVNADCRVLDIPLNMNFTVWSSGKNTLQLAGGISSYLMLNENYSFSYKNPAVAWSKNYYITNRNKHYLGILNFGAAYQRKVSDEISVGIQPYLKVPVTDIGYGNVKLMSAGIVTFVNLNLFSKNK